MFGVSSFGTLKHRPWYISGSLIYQIIRGCSLLMSCRGRGGFDKIVSFDDEGERGGQEKSFFGRQRGRAKICQLKSMTSLMNSSLVMNISSKIYEKSRNML